MTESVRRVRREPFGILPNGCAVDLITLSSRGGASASIMTYGAGIQAVRVPDSDDALADVALGHARLEPYLAQPQYIGSTVGRVANRIARGRFTLDGQTYQVPVNNGENALHGGDVGFDKLNWRVEAVHEEADSARVTLSCVSWDGDQGFPGTLSVTAIYTFDDSNALSVEYRATTDRTTLVNLSNHAYWNLAGEGAAEGAMGHLVTIAADHFLPTDAGSIPTGHIRPVVGTPFDFRTPTLVGERVRDAADEQLRIGRGYDHNMVIARAPSDDPRFVARVEHQGSGRAMEVFSNQPGVQFYSGNFLNGTTAGKAGRLYRQGDAVVLEPQMFPDTPNQPDFGSLRLEPGQTYRNIIVWRFSA